MILLLAPDAPERGELTKILEQLGQDVTARDASSLPSGTIDRFDAVVLDLAAGQDALRVLRRQAKAAVRVPIVCIADRRRPDASAAAMRLGAVDLVARPVHADSLAAALGNAQEMSSRAPEAQRAAPVAEPGLGGVLGTSPIMRSVQQLARQIGPSRCAVLIVGEPGTGREAVARLIHSAGARDGEPFVKLACSATTSAEMRGVMVEQPSATIYLENIAEAPRDLLADVEAHLQVTASSVAISDPRRMPRFIAGAQPRLWSRIDHGELRRELIDTLSVVRIDLPPLRQRPDDIPLFAMNFLKEACAQNQAPAKTFEPAALTLLGALPWRGNASELRSLCERLAVIVPRGVVRLDDVVANVNFGGAEAVTRARETLKAARDRFERDHIVAVLQHHRGRMGAAARELGIERTNLYRKIKQLGVRWEAESD